MKKLIGTNSLGKIKLFILSFSLVAICGVTVNANAKWTRTHAADCTTIGGSAMDTNYAIHNNSSTQEMVVLCAVSDTDRFQKENITTLNLHGYDDHTGAGATAMACRSLWYAVGGSCGASTSTSSAFLGNFTLSPSLSQWTAATRADFGYIYLRLPAKQGSAWRSSFRGFYTYGT